MKLYVMRHGEAEYNTKGLINSNPSIDNNLTDTGVEQAKQLAEQLRGIPIELIYTSEFPRTQQTTAIIKEVHDVPIKIHPLLSELGVDLDGGPVKEWSKQRRASADSWNFRLNNGETLAEGYRRAEKFIEHVKNENAEHIAVVTHGFVIIALQSIVEGYSVGELYEQGDPGMIVTHEEFITLEI